MDSPSQLERLAEPNGQKRFEITVVYSPKDCPQDEPRPKAQRMRCLSTSLPQQQAQTAFHHQTVLKFTN
ncbi:MAG: hypothetical protein JNM43_15210 [Planctomycetaceae bacterium]|nr:hypothetical protein [Planctomycetaceae bacterium]